MMKKIRTGAGLLGLAVAILLVAGCLVSGTFVIVQEFSFTGETGFYYYEVDITGEPDWDEHKDKIDYIDHVGFELWITNNEAVPVTFNVYIEDPDEGPYTTFAQVDADATKILDNLVLPAGPGVQRHVTYGESFSYLTNIDVLKTMVKTGRFDYYGVSEGGGSSGFIVDSAKVIVTFSASY